MIPLFQSAARYLRWSAMVALTPLLAGCYTYGVRQYTLGRDSYNAIPGIPFYVKRAACRHETVYQENILHVRLLIEELTISPEGSVSKRDTVFDRDKLVPGDAAGQAMLQTLKDRIRQGTTDKAPVIEAFSGLTAYDPAGDWSQPGRSVVISNQTTSTTFVDYSTTYYMNTQRPIVGSASNTFKLAPDGTLSEGSATVEDKSLETIAGFVPFKDILTRIVTPTPAPSIAFAVGPTKRFQYTLISEAAPVLHTLARTQRQTTQTCEWQPEIKRTDAGYEYVRKPASAPAAPEATKGNNITISGQLTLPPKE
ncbi:MAG TPA: hypothetical protein VF541_21390 [Longimicrobium sp.]|jgi:hypothetical protein